LATTSVADMTRRKLDAGTLPLDAPVKLWARFGRGDLCSACEQPIHPSEPEYEPEYQGGRPVVRFHAACHATWNDERERRNAK
jgi:hypothetical protein